MNNQTHNKVIHQRQNKLYFLFLLILVACAIFLSSVLRTVTTDRRIPSHNTTLHDRSYRGAIISADNYMLSNSQKTYQAIIRGESLSPEKKAIFIKLFSIYSNIDEQKLLQKINNKNGKTKLKNIVLSKTINTSTAMQLKLLGRKLRKIGVFRSIKTSSGIEVLFGLDIIENGETRRFPLKDILSPALGYVSKKHEDNYIRPVGKKGLEKYYNEHITSKLDGYFKGKRDVLGRIIHDNNSINQGRVDGLDLHLNIPLSFQVKIEAILDEMKKELQAEEILVGVMESSTGKVLSLASSERYDPLNIQQDQIYRLNPKFSEYPYEAGSVIKPLTLAIALDHNKTTPYERFDTYNGKIGIGDNHFITDDVKYKSLTATNIIVHSSNVGISRISWRLSGEEFRNGLIGFGLSKPSGLDLSRDLSGHIKPLYQMNYKVHRANSSYGYGMLVTFSQLFKAYSAFNNDGIAVTPHIVNYLGDKKDRHYTLKPKIGNLVTVSKKTANEMRNILIEVVNRGTGRAAKYPGLILGGKTGTAHIVENGKYAKVYHSSFYGFANDNCGKKYTIGVLVMKAKKPQAYFASKSAVPIFKKIVDTLVEDKYLTVDKEAAKEFMAKKEEEEAKKKAQRAKIDAIKEQKIKAQKAAAIKDLFTQTKKSESIKKAPKKAIKKNTKNTSNSKPASKPKKVKPASKIDPDKSVHSLFQELF